LVIKNVILIYEDVLYVGIHEKLDYLKDELHVDAVCIGPMNPTPNFNYGYNIINYTAICPHHYGSMEDFDKLRVALHKKSTLIFGIYCLFALHSYPSHLLYNL